MNTPSIFKFESVELRVIVKDDGELWFVAADVAAALEYRDAEVATRHLDDDEKGYTELVYPSGRQKIIAVNESGLYSLVLKSRKPEAKRFKKWVTSEVLPTIRKTGKYETPYSVGKTDTLTKDEQDYLRGLVKAHVETLPKEQQGGAAIKMWSKLKSHFGVPYRLIPRREFAEAVSLLTRATLDNPATAPTLPQLLTGKRWLVHMTAEGHLIWNEVQPDVVLISMADMTQAVGKAWWGCVDTLADLNKICSKTGQKFDIQRKAA